MRKYMAGICVVLAAAMSAALVTVTPTGSADAVVAGGARVTPCSRGLVALTFDDGPSPEVTPAVLDLLGRTRTRATFFVVGERVSRYPRLVRRMDARGFVVANHSYRHEQLTTLSSRQVARSLRRTRRAIVTAGATASPLMRPPYGLIDAGVHAVVRDLGMVAVMWDVDPRNWQSRSATEIASTVLRHLRTGNRNTVLLHDGVANSVNTLRALPTIVRRARARGFCFAELGRRGRALPPVPAVTVAGARADEGSRRVSLPFVVRLSEPTSRATSVRVRTTQGSATESRDYSPRSLRLRFPVGSVRRLVSVSVLRDRLDEPTERVGLRLSAARGLRIGDRRAVGRILDDDPVPTVAVTSTALAEPAAGQTATADVAVRLSRPSGRTVRVSVRTVAGSATTGEDYTHVRTSVRIEPGRRQALLPVTVLGDGVTEPAESFTVRIVRTRHARVDQRSGTVTIQPAN